MKHITSIAGINFILLLVSLLVLSVVKTEDGEMMFMMPVMVLTLVNTVLFGVAAYYGKKNRARSYLFSALVVLVVGTSSCVVIKPRKKRPKKKPRSEQPVEPVKAQLYKNEPNRYI
ncbi:MAG: hypothetical protein ACHQF2_01905 [Flavobacteriales bacterium]